MLLALTRAVPRSIDRCELTHLQREPIDYARAVEQHAAYEAMLVRAGCTVQRLPAAPDLPDSVFVEDTAVVFDDLAVIARPGAESRRPEVEAMVAALRPLRRLAFIQPPGTLDGGDVLVTPGKVFVGISGRTNADGARQLATHLAPLGFAVIPIPVEGCLHLKSAVTLSRRLPPLGGRSTLVINPGWVDANHFADFELIEVDPSEPAAANVLSVNDVVICAEEHPRTRQRLEALGFVTLSVPAAELAKAEGGVTCCSVLVTAA
jgi:dimethylargininase